MIRLSDVRSLKNETLLLFFGILLAIVAFSGGLANLVVRWYQQDEYGHGFFIPLITLWLLWHRREALTQSIGQPAVAQGVSLIFCSLMLLILGEVTAIFILIQLGFLLSLVGLVLCYGGRSLLKVSRLPIVLLLFCIPLPYFMDAQLSWRLQLLSSGMGVDFLRAFGYTVYLEGNVIDLGNYKLQVVDACSGLRYLYPLLSIAFLMAYMYPARFVWRALVFLSAIPLTVIMNSFRIAMVGVLVDRWGSGMADGFLHFFEGWVIFTVCQVVLFYEIWWIEKCTLKRHWLEIQQFPEVTAVPPASPREGGVGKVLPVVLICLVLGFLFAQFVGGRQEIKPERQRLTAFPALLGDWRAEESSLDAQVEKVLGLDDYFLADYQDPQGARVNFYVGYYASQRKGVSPHSPQVCIPGGGWVVTQVTPVQVGMPDNPFTAVRVEVMKAGQRLIVYYWFEQRGRRISNEYWMKWYLLLDALFVNRTDGALVRFSALQAENEPEGAADARIQAFLPHVLPKLPAFVPQ